MKPPFFSICIATFNVEKTISACLESIFSQSETDFEVIVIDGASSDGTLTVLRKYQDSIHLVSERDKGISDAWNKAIAIAKGEWLFFMGADDRLASSDVLSKVRARLRTVTGLMAYSDVKYVHDGSDVSVHYGEPWDAEIFRSYGMTFCHQGVFHARQLFETYGKFDLNFRICADYELLLRYLKANDAVYIKDIVVALVEYGGLSTQDKNAHKVLKEYMRAQALNGLTRRSLRFYRAYVGALAKALMVWGFGEKRAASVIDWLRPLAKRPRRI